MKGFPVDKRRIVAQNKYENVHKELLEVGSKLLSNERLTDISLNSLSEYTNISKTTIYEHFDSSFNNFLSQVIEHSWKKIKLIYNDKLSNNPTENILTIFGTWHEYNQKNILLTRNIYASYILFADTHYFPVLEILVDIDNELKKIKHNEKNTYELFRIFYVRIDEIIVNPNIKNEDKLLKELENYLKA